MLDRRDFLSALGGSAAAAMLPLDHFRVGDVPVRTTRPLADVVRLDKNENPAGPFESARRAMVAAMGEAGRYPSIREVPLVDALAKLHGVKREQIVLGCGSSEILKLCTERLTTRARGLVTAHPTFETPSFVAGLLGHPVTAVPVTGSMQLDLDAMAAAARGAGMVFLCNPNNPTGTVHGAAAVRAFIARVRRESPQTYVLVDEAYHEYVDDPGYASMIPETRSGRVLVSRTFSKVFGMAGVRVGYAVASEETASALQPWRVDSAVSQFASAGALASLADTAAIRAEQARNRTQRARVTAWFTSRGYTVSRSDANFVFAHIRREVGPVIAECLRQGVAVGRPFPPLTDRLRLTIGSEADLTTALGVLAKVLA
jgi:histidinol-phosphate aminotransferase